MLDLTLDTLSKKGYQVMSVTPNYNNPANVTTTALKTLPELKGGRSKPFT